MSRSVIVIGAGIGGMTAAIHLARAGLHVTVIEKNGEPGGRCGRLTREGHTFDTGPTLFVMPRLYESEFRALGSDVRERLDLQRVDPSYRLVFDDGSNLSLTSDLTLMREQLDRIEPGSFDGLRRYLDEGERHYEIVLDNLVNRDFRRRRDFFNPRMLSRIARVKPFVKHYRHTAAYVDSARLKSAFTFQDLYVGLSPFEAPATFSLLPYSEMAHGVWFPSGGMYSIAEALMELASRAGVEFRFNIRVTRIDTTSGTATGVSLGDGSRMKADVVLANADLPYVYRRLLPDARQGKAMSRKTFSCSAISFFWGVDRKYDSLGPHTLFLADEFRENFDTIVRERGLANNPSLYIHAPSRVDPSMAPDGQDSITAIVPVGHLDDRRKQDWDKLCADARGHVFRRLRTVGITDIESHIKFETSYTPLSWADRYNLTNGSTHGLAHTLTQMAWFRPSNRHRRYRNLYFAGASTHPGTGVPIAMVSGRLVADRITAELD